MSTPEEEVGSVQIGSGSIDPRDFRVDARYTDPEHYVAVLLLESTSDSASYQPLYEESFVLVKAESDDEAREKATEYGKQQEYSFHNENHEYVSWKLKRVVEVRPVEDATFDDGSELYSRFFRNAASYESLDMLLGDSEE